MVSEDNGRKGRKLEKDCSFVLHPNLQIDSFTAAIHFKKVLMPIVVFNAMQG